MKKTAFIELIVRVVIRHREKILLCRMKPKGHYFLPGGHVEFGEDIREALKREIKEELNVSAQILCFIGIGENIYREGKKLHHEINIVFSGKLGHSTHKAMEDHIEFSWIDKGQLLKLSALPKVLMKNIARWLKDGKIFSISERYI